MLRQWILSAVAGLTLLTPLAAVPAAQAREPAAPREADHDWDRDRDHWHRHYEVMYRTCCDRPWVCFGRFDGRWEAERVTHDLRAQGYEAFFRD